MLRDRARSVEFLGASPLPIVVAFPATLKLRPHGVAEVAYQAWRSSRNKAVLDAVLQPQLLASGKRMSLSIGRLIQNCRRRRDLFVC